MTPDLDCPDDDVWREQNDWADAELKTIAGVDGTLSVGIRHIPCVAPAERTVLLVHGASATSRTFMVPRGGLARYLRTAGWDVWTLDWRTSGLTVPDLIAAGTAPDAFNLTNARHDLATALAFVRKAIPARPIHIVAHCIGGALVSDCLANDLERFQDVGNVVLTTLGLFFRSGLDDWVKGNERLLEDIWWRLAEKADADPKEPVPAFISPWVADRRFATQHGWPETFEAAYKLWSRSPLPHPCGNEFCRRASFMFGMPYRPDDMRAMHDAPRPGGLWAQFGRMPLVAYMHCVQNLRRGWVAPWNTDDADQTSIDSAGLLAAGTRHLTLITGNENQVWHRDSIDRMYEWALRMTPAEAHARVHKHVLPRYGHQDLYWSDRAAQDVYPLIAAALTPSAT